MSEWLTSPGEIMSCISTDPNDTRFGITLQIGGGGSLVPFPRTWTPEPMVEVTEVLTNGPDEPYVILDLNPKPPAKPTPRPKRKGGC